MKKMFAALAFAIALPAVAHAQAAPAPAPEKKCCCEKMGGKMDCCDKAGDAKPGHDEHEGHDMSQHPQPAQPQQ